MSLDRSKAVTLAALLLLVALLVVQVFRGDGRGLFHLCFLALGLVSIALEARTAPRIAAAEAPAAGGHAAHGGWLDAARRYMRQEGWWVASWLIAILLFSTILTR